MAAKSIFYKVWAMPIALAVVTLLGLMSAIMAHGGVWHWVSWLALAWPIYLMIKHSAKAFK
jgi:hypothetical protein